MGAFIDELRKEGFAGYHHSHPFMRLLHDGKLTKPQLQGWAIQRYYYQRRMPVKNAAIYAQCPLPEVRRVWALRIMRQVVEDGDQGYFELWLKFCDGLGLKREEVLSAEILPGVRFAVDAYVEFCLTRSWIEGVASTLSELFFSQVLGGRIEAFERHYPWISPEGLEYWRIAQNIVGDGGALVAHILEQHCTAEEWQAKARAAVRFKNGVQWSMLDSIYMAYVVGDA